MPSMPIFRPQPPVAPLNEAGQQALAELLRVHASKKQLRAYSAKAAEHLTTVAGQLNDRGTERDQRHEKKRARAAANGEEEDEEDRGRHEEFQGRVEALTTRMDKSIRAVIDDQTWAMCVPEILKAIVDQVEATAESTMRTIQDSTSTSTQNRRRQRAQGSDDEDDDNNDENDEADIQRSEQNVPLQFDPSEAPSAILKSTLDKRMSDWSSKSLTERYGSTNEYTGFYRTVYDAKHPGDDAPPVPHSSLWFTEDGNRGAMGARRPQPGAVGQPEEDEDSDLEIAGERISTKCPITFLTFKDPLSSTRCPHSFEKNAILDMLRLSPTSLPLTAEQNEELSRLSNRRALEQRQREIRTPTVKCPVCDLPLTEADLRPDPVLLRKVKRLEAAATRQEKAASDIDGESGSDEDDLTPGTQRKPVGLGSSPPRRFISRAERIKMERARSRSIIPQTQLPEETP